MEIKIPLLRGKLECFTASLMPMHTCSPSIDHIYNWPFQGDAGANSDFTLCFNIESEAKYNQLMWHRVESLYAGAWAGKWSIIHMVYKDPKWRQSNTCDPLHFTLHFLKVQTIIMRLTNKTLDSRAPRNTSATK